MNNEFLPRFKYSPNVYDIGVVEFADGICDCCGKKVNAYVSSMYTREEINCICMDCIASGEAAKKFDGSFLQDADHVEFSTYRDGRQIGESAMIVIDSLTRKYEKIKV